MASSRRYLASWAYDEDDDGLDGTVGRLLSPSFEGSTHQLTETGRRTRLKPLDQTGQTFAAGSTTEPQGSLKENSGLQKVQTRASQAIETLPLSVWVNGTGQVVRDDRAGYVAAKPMKSQPPPTCPAHLHPEVVRRRIHPGMMREFHQTPVSTMHDHFVWRATEHSPVSFKHHFHKTDFSEYNEAAAQFAKHLVTAKGGNLG